MPRKKTEPDRPAFRRWDFRGLGKNSCPVVQKYMGDDLSPGRRNRKSDF